LHFLIVPMHSAVSGVISEAYYRREDTLLRTCVGGDYCLVGELFSCSQKTHPYHDINILPSIACVIMPLYIDLNEA
jgi:hypothetical protein